MRIPFSDGSPEPDLAEKLLLAGSKRNLVMRLGNMNHDQAKTKKSQGKRRDSAEHAAGEKENKSGEPLVVS